MIVLIVSLAGGVEAQNAAERLVPGALGVRTDGRGNTWNLEQNGSIGRVGNTMVNSGLSLEVNGEKFTGFQPMMTADGKGIVLQGRPIDAIPGLQVQRRIRILHETGGLRYAEMFFNGSTDPIALNIALVTNFSGNYKTFLTDRGRTEPVLLGEEESGIIVLPGATQSTRAFLFSLAGLESSLKPSLTARNRYAMTFQYSLNLAPGETRILLHEVAQTVIPQSFERRRLLDLFSPFSLRAAASELPEEWVPFLANVSTDALSTGEDWILETGARLLADEAGDQDVLLVGVETRLVGKVVGSPVVLETPYGNAEFSLEEISAIEKRAGADGVRLYLRDGQVLAGRITSGELSLQQAGGGEVAIDFERVERLVFRKEETRSPFAEEVVALVDTWRGERFSVKSEEILSFPFLTAWGPLEVTSDRLVRIGPAGKGRAGLRVELDDGTRCFGWFAEDSLEFLSKSLGRVLLPTSEIRSVHTPLSEMQSGWESGAAVGTSGLESTLFLAGGQVVTGQPTSSLISVLTGAVVIDTDFSQIRSLSLSEEGGDGAGRIRIERWDGGVVSGVPREVVLSFRVGEEVWRIPLRDLERFETASPELTSEAREEISGWINQLGSDSWEEREAASRELGAFGYLARSLLKKHLQVTGDPEVKRRLERILSQLD